MHAPERHRLDAVVVGLSPSASPASPAWTRSQIVASGSSSDPAQLARVDGDGDTWITGVIMGTQDLGTPVGTLSSAAGGSLELLVLGPDGTLRSGSAFGGGAGSPALGDMALGPNRSSSSSAGTLLRTISRRSP